MKTLNLIQGSPEWESARLNHFCASEAAAMMGASKKTSRTELLRMKKTGSTKEFSEWAQKNLIDRGHEIETLARPIAAAIVGEEFYPVTGTTEIDGLPLLASFDGLTMDETIGWECKSHNKALAAMVAAGELEPEYYWQLEHQLLVSGAEKELFTPTDGTEEGTLTFWYTPVPGRREQLIAGWKQFKADLDSYVHQEVIPAAVAAPQIALPAVSIQVKGAIELASNLPAFGERLKEFIDGLNLKPETDQDFANAEFAVKALEKAQEALEAAESGALAQTASIDEMRRTVAAYKESARSTRLMLEKLVKGRKEQIRGEIVQGGIRAFAEHMAGLNARLGKNYMPAVATDFLAAVKGKKTITSLRDAVDTELARAKIEANSVADRIQINVNTLRELAADHAFLFADAAQIVLKAPEDFTLLVKSRIAEHKEKEAKRIEAERERIRVEEAEKLLLKAAAEHKTTRTAPCGPLPTMPESEPPPAGQPAPLSRSREQAGAADQLTVTLPTPITDEHLAYLDSILYDAAPSTKNMLRSLERDAMTMALRLYDESPDTFSPEVAEVMDRWAPRVRTLFGKGDE